MFFTPFYMAAVVIGVWSFACGVYDLTHRRLPNFLTLGMHLLGLAMLVIAGHGFLEASVASCLLAWGVALALTLPAYAINWLGAGDVKFLAAIGLITGIEFLLITYVLAGLMAGLVILYGISIQRYLPYINLHLSAFNLHLPNVLITHGKKLPFGSLIAAGVIITMTILPSWDLIP